MDPEVANGTIAQEAYDRITELLHLDNGFDDLPSEDRLKQRQLVLKKKVDAYFEWAKLKYTQVTQQGTIGKALGYSINQEKYLRRFLYDGNIPMDNNPAEQAIRPFTIGRKNFVLIESDHGAKASAMIYSLVETAKWVIDLQLDFVQEYPIRRNIHIEGLKLKEQPIDIFGRKHSNMSTKHKKSLHFCRDGMSRDHSSTFKIKPFCSCSGIPAGQQMTRGAMLL